MCTVARLFTRHLGEILAVLGDFFLLFVLLSYRPVYATHQPRDLAFRSVQGILFTSTSPLDPCNKRNSVNIRQRKRMVHTRQNTFGYDTRASRSHPPLAQADRKLCFTSPDKQKCGSSRWEGDVSSDDNEVSRRYGGERPKMKSCGCNVV